MKEYIGTTLGLACAICWFLTFILFSTGGFLYEPNLLIAVGESILSFVIVVYLVYLLVRRLRGV